MKTNEISLVSSEQYGLTKLEYFTAAALTGLCANPAHIKSDIGALAVNNAMEAINELNAKHQMDNRVLDIPELEPPAAPIYDDSNDDLPW